MKLTCFWYRVIMILSFFELSERLSELFPRHSPVVQPASVDLTLQSPVVIPPLSFQLAATEEYLRMPADLAGRFEGKSTVGRMGLFTHVSAGFVDPGFEGTLTLELFNASSTTITLPPYFPVGQIAYFRLSTPLPPSHLYPKLGNHYQYQQEPTPPHNATSTSTSTSTNTTTQLLPQVRGVS